MPKMAVFERSRRELSLGRVGRCSQPLGCGAIGPEKSVEGVCQDSDSYGMYTPINTPLACEPLTTPATAHISLKKTNTDGFLDKYH